MLALAVPLLLLAQAPEVPPPSVAAQPSLSAAFVDKHLLSVEVELFSGLQVRQGERTLRLGEDGSEFLSLVPDAARLMGAAQHDFAVGRVLNAISLAVAGASLVAVLVASVAGALRALLTVSLVALAACGGALVLAVVAMPFMVAAQREFFEAVSVYNHRLLTLPEATPPAALGPSAGSATVTVLRF